MLMPARALCRSSTLKNIHAAARQLGRHLSELPALRIGDRQAKKRAKRCRGDEAYYPRSMRNLASEVRLKAIEIANALLEEGYDEGKAIHRDRQGERVAKGETWPSSR